MALLDITRAPRTGRGSGAWLSALFGTLADRAEARRTRKALDALSDHELNDIGLTRADLENFGRS